MKLPRVQFTVRRSMALVAAVGVVMATWSVLERRRERFERVWSYHMELAGPMIMDAYQRHDPKPSFKTPEGHWHFELALKYARAAARPWLPIEPDPPKP